MFTGLIQDLSQILDIVALGKGKQFQLSLPDAYIDRVREGDSIMLNGVCSTAVKVSDDRFTVHYLPETLEKTTFASAKIGQSLNFEPSATPQSLLGGHLLSGHVDCRALILEKQAPDPFSVLRIAIPEHAAALVVEKGSIAIDGVSLTVVDVSTSGISVHLIPETLARSSLGEKAAGDEVNLEFDLIAKYVARYCEVHAGGGKVD